MRCRSSLCLSVCPSVRLSVRPSRTVINGTPSSDTPATTQVQLNGNWKHIWWTSLKQFHAGANWLLKSAETYQRCRRQRAVGVGPTKNKLMNGRASPRYCQTAWRPGPLIVSAIVVASSSLLTGPVADRNQFCFQFCSHFSFFFNFTKVFFANYES